MAARSSASISVDVATEAATKVADKAKEITQALRNRVARARTNPFEKVEMDDEDSLVTSVESVIANAKK